MAKRTIGDVFDTLNDDQKDAFFYILGKPSKELERDRKAYLYTIATLNTEQSITLMFLIDKALEKK